MILKEQSMYSSMNNEKYKEYKHDKTFFQEHKKLFQILDLFQKKKKKMNETMQIKKKKKNRNKQ